jgi:hypothetical protein
MNSEAVTVTSHEEVMCMTEPLAHLSQNLLELAQEPISCEGRCVMMDASCLIDVSCQGREQFERLCAMYDGSAMDVKDVNNLNLLVCAMWDGSAIDVKDVNNLNLCVRCGAMWWDGRCDVVGWTCNGCQGHEQFELVCAMWDGSAIDVKDMNNLNLCVRCDMKVRGILTTRNSLNTCVRWICHPCVR